MPVTDITSLRKAALTLHALPEKDVQRVLARLDERKRDALKPLLSELSGLGIPKGRQWVTDDDGGAVAEASRELVWRLDPQVVLSLLMSQSIDTALTIMQITPWPWLEGVVAAWPPEQRHVVRERLTQHRAIPKRLADDLLDRMVACLNANAPSGTPSALLTSPSSASNTSAAKRPWYHGVMSLFMLT